MWKPFEAPKPKKAAQGAKTGSKSFIWALLRTPNGPYKWSQKETRMLLNKKKRNKNWNVEDFQSSIAQEKPHKEPRQSPNHSFEHFYKSLMAHNHNWSQEETTMLSKEKKK